MRICEWWRGLLWEVLLSHRTTSILLLCCDSVTLRVKLNVMMIVKACFFPSDFFTTTRERGVENSGLFAVFYFC